MTDYYLKSTTGSDANSGLTNWGNAKATLAGVFAVCAAGDRIFVSQSHAETQASAMTLASPGTAAAPVLIFCMNDAAAPPTTLATTATISTTGANNISPSGFAYAYGISLQVGSAGNNCSLVFNSANPWWWKFDTCNLVLTNTNANAKFTFGANSTGVDDQLLELVNTNLVFNSSGQSIALRCAMRMRNGAVQTTAPTTLFSAQNTGISGFADWSGVDMSIMGSGSTLVDISAINFHTFKFRNCKLGASVAITSGSAAGQGGSTVELINSDSSATNYRYQKTNFAGTITQETTIVRTGGASNGTTSLSRKMVSSANASFYYPLALGPIAVWNDNSGASKTVTIEVISDNVTFTDAELGVQVEYPGDASSPETAFINDLITNIVAGTPTNQASSSATWTTTGLTTPVKQKLEVTFTPQLKGLFYVTILLAKASSTLYVDPLVTIS